MGARAGLQNGFKGRKWICALSALLGLHLIASATPANASPQIQPNDIAVFQAANEDQRTHILIKLVQAGFLDAAEEMLHRFPLQGPKAQNRTLFIEGAIYEKRGQLPAAAAKFRAVLASDPQATLVRAELAMVLARMNETGSAKHHLQLLEGEMDDPNQRAGIRSFIDRIDASHPLTFSGFVSLSPSTNINQGSSHDTVYSPGFGGTNGVDSTGSISKASQKQSGIGISAGGNVGYAKMLSPHFQAVLAASASTTYYPQLRTATLGLSQSAEIRRVGPNGFVGFGAIASEGIDPEGVNLTYNSYGPRVSFLRRFSPRDQLSGSATYEWRTYQNNPTSNGTALTVSAVLTHALDASANVAMIGGYENVSQQLDFNSYQDLTVGAGFYKEMQHGITLQGQGTARFAIFDAENPFTLSTRQDTLLTGALTLTKRDWNWFGFAPALNYTYQRNFSNISLYDFDSHALDFRLTKDF
ncbi:surface lipoprotein assembly modifier [Aestuariivirga litoralis]|uniref:surface lipoprotein assembly modifier n=1 Tax=Aestuariivirga litoralis TaxID=2650924 RepID=UPI0018C628B7|nr:surface lipoprotein assembly modifier [Aestuariivirga litoralis]MBG1233014.1 DUF560 domain-containing protein [Aestuariivirga litoralis]